MSQVIPIVPLIGFILAVIRVSAWMLLCPPFNTRAIPRRVKIGIAAALALPIAPQLSPAHATLEPLPFLTEAAVQMASGLILGFFSLLLFSAFQAAGAYIDTLGGFSMSMSMDPYSNNQTSLIGRFYNLVAITLLLVMNGHLLIIKGFMTSFQAVPLGGAAFARYKELVIKDLGYFAVASIEIVGPLIVAYFLTEVCIGLLNKAAPQLNVLMFGFPLKIFISIIMVIMALPIAKTAMQNIISHILHEGSLIMQFAQGG